jgi:hypothetical protein
MQFVIYGAGKRQEGELKQKIKKSKFSETGEAIKHTIESNI